MVVGDTGSDKLSDTYVFDQPRDTYVPNRMVMLQQAVKMKDKWPTLTADQVTSNMFAVVAETGHEYILMIGSEQRYVSRL